MASVAQKPNLRFKDIPTRITERIRTTKNKPLVLPRLHAKQVLSFNGQPFKRTTSLNAKPTWLTVSAILLILLLIGNLLPGFQINYAEGAYTTSSVDSNGNNHLGNNSTKGTYAYNLANDSNEASQQQLGIDPNWHQGVTRRSYALKYDGSATPTTADNVYIADNSALDLTSQYNGYTISLWTKLDSLPASGQYTFVQKSADGDEGYWLRVNSTGTLSVRALGTTRSSNSGAVTAGNWAHIAVTCDGTVLSFYVDGQSVGTDSSASCITTDDADGLYFGTNSGRTETLKGVMDEVHISSTVRYNSNFEPVRREREDTSTIGLWHFDEGAGTTAYDSGTKGLNGTLRDGTTTGNGTSTGPIWVTGANAVMDGYDGSKGWRSGESGAGNITLSERSSVTDDSAYELKATGSNAARFTGGGSIKVNVGSLDSNISYQNLTQFTIEAWVYPTNISTTQYIWGQRNESSANNPITSLYVSGGNYGVVAHKSDTTTLSLTGTAQINTWAHVAGVFDKTNQLLRLYINGSLAGSATWIPDTRSEATGGGNAIKYVGAEMAGFNFHGKIDEFRYSNTIRYASDFTPSRRFAPDAYTQLLYHLDEGTGSSVSDTSTNNYSGTLFNSWTWDEGIYAVSDDQDQIAQNWALPGYAHRKQLQVATSSTALDAGDGIEATENRGTIIQNKQSRSDGKDWRVVYQPSDRYRSLSFDNGDNVIVPDSSSLDPGTGDFTVEAWVKGSSMEDSDIIVAKSNGGSASSTYGYLFGVFDSLKPTLYFTTEANALTKVQGTTSLVNDRWYHLAVVIDRDNASKTKIFVDGVDDSATISGTALTSNNGSIANDVSFVIGSESDGGFNWQGYIDEVRVSDAVRYSSNFTPSRTPYVTDSSTVGLWHFDEGSGEFLRDSSGNDNNGIRGAEVTSASTGDEPAWSTDGVVSTVQEVPRLIPRGHTLYFDDANTQYATAANESNFDFERSDQFTVEGWIRTGSTDSGFIAAKLSTNNVAGYYIYMDVSGGIGKLLGGIAANGTSAYAEVKGSTQINDDTWHHVAMVYHGNSRASGVVLYVDGNRETVTVNGDNLGSSSILNNNAFVIGGNGTVNQNFTGYIDEVRVSNTLRYRSNFTPQTTPFGTDVNTIGLWHIDEGSGNLTDFSGNSNTATTSGGPTWVQNGGRVDSTNQTQFRLVAPVGTSTNNRDYYIYYGNPNEGGAAQSYSSYALLLDGVDSKASKADNSTLDLTTAGTISMWFKRASGAKVHVGKSANGNLSYVLQVFSDNKIYFTVSGNGSTLAYFTSTSTYADTDWNHLAGVYNGSTLTVYLNGASIAGSITGSVPASLFNSTAPFDIGYYYGGSDQWSTGRIDEVRVYNTALTASEVLTLAKSPSVSSASLKANWKLDNSTILSTTAVDSSGNSNDATLTGFNFNANSNWVPATLSPDSTVTVTTLITEQESPIFFEWRSVTTGSYSAWTTDRSKTFQLTTGEQQLGTSSGVYVSINPHGVYSKEDHYVISSWAIEAATTSGTNPARGKANAFPQKANLVATASGVDIIDAETNNLWMRIPAETNGIMGNGAGFNAPNAVTAKNGRIYVVSSDGLIEIQFDLDDAHKWTSSGNSSWGGNLADRDDASTFASASGHALNSTVSTDVSVAVNSDKQYVAVSHNTNPTNAGITVIAHSTQYVTNNASPSGSAVSYYGNGATTDVYSDVVITSGAELYGANTTDSQLDRWDNVSTTGNDTTPTVSYSTTSAPALRNGTINDLTVTEGTSLADNASNSVAIAHNTGVDVIEEHTTTTSALTRHYARPLNAGISNWTHANFKNAAYFDGTDDYIQTDYPGVSGSGARTFEAWVYFTGNAGAVGGYGHTSNAYQRMDFYIDSSGDMAFLQNTSAFYLDTNVTANSWHHLVWVYPGTTGLDTSYAYVDGTKITASAAGKGTASNIVPQTNTTSTVKLRIGSATNSGATFNGYIDEVRFSDSARYSDPTITVPSAPFTTDGNTKGLWHLDEMGTQTLVDYTVNNYVTTLGSSSSAESIDAKIVAPVIAGSADITTAVGMYGSTSTTGGLDLDGTDDYLRVADTGAGGPLDVTGDLTLSAWINPDSLASDDGSHIGIVGKADAYTNKRNYMLAVTTTGGQYFQISQDGSSSVVALAASGVTISTGGGWYHVVAVYDTNGTSSATLKVYVNGVLSGTSSTGIYAIYDNDAPLIIGAQNLESTATVSDPYFDGQIDDVRVYNRALSQDQVNQLKNAKQQGVMTEGLVGHWKFDESTLRDVSGTMRSFTYDASNNGNALQLMNGESDSPASNNATNGPLPTVGNTRQGGVLWVGTNGASGDDGALTAISLDSNRAIQNFTETNSDLPDNDIHSLAMHKGGLALVGTDDAGAWNPGAAGFVVEDTASTVATDPNPIRFKSGTVRLKNGVRLK